MQQWYQHYQAQAHTYATAASQDSAATDYAKEHAQVTLALISKGKATFGGFFYQKVAVWSTFLCRSSDGKDSLECLLTISEGINEE